MTRHSLSPELWLEDDEDAAYGNNLIDIHDSVGGIIFVDLEEIPKLVDTLQRIYAKYQQGERGKNHAPRSSE